MDPLCVVVLDVLMKEAVQVPLVEYNHVIQQLDVDELADFGNPVGCLDIVRGRIG